FFAIAAGLPPGLASLLVQTQALFTILFAVVAFRETPTRRQLSGVAVAFAGLVLILFTVGHDLTAVGFFLALGSAISWGVGNILLKHTEDVDMLGLIVWLSLVPPVPALALSLLLDGPFALAGAIAAATRRPPWRHSPCSCRSWAPLRRCSCSASGSVRSASSAWRWC